MPALSFRLKLALAMLALVAGVTAVTLLVIQQSVEATYRRMFQERFQRDVAFFSTLQDARLAVVKSKCLELGRSVRLIAAVEEGDTDLLYKIALDELRDVLTPAVEGTRRATFFRFVSAAGAVLQPTDERAGLHEAGGGSSWEQLARTGGPSGGAGRQQIGYLAPEIRGRPALQEVIVTRIVDPVTARALGALAVGFPVEEFGEEAEIRSGIWFEKRVYSRAIPEALRPGLAAQVTRDVERADAPSDVVLDLEGVPHRMFRRALHPEAAFPPAYEIGLYSLAEPLARQRTLRRQVLGFGAIALLIALGLSLLLSRTLSVPIRELVAGTEEIGRGNLEVRVPVRRRDEIGQLAGSFNEMAAGLALKERYRAVLDVVADKEVAQQLIDGRLTLGGELREVSVLFCDIRGFTPLTEGMDPAEVIQLLNEHMTALTTVVHAHRGVVDKFVGDALVALFGAPKTTGDDARNAVRAALQMIEERQRLNATSRYRIEIGIGIASGVVVAGCMGSADRLNYTVLGERVNLAARLCAQARGMEVLIDDETRRRLAGGVGVEALPEMQLKGFRAPVAAYRLRDVA